MRKIILLLSFIILIISCKSTKTLSDRSVNQNTISVGSELIGSSFENAIIIKEKSESKGIDAEYAWLRLHYPGYVFKGQSLSEYNGKPYDILNIVIAKGEVKSIYFDISNFYGKF